jgi:hypothetical protein
MLVAVAAVHPVRSMISGLGLVTGQAQVVPVAHATELQHLGEAPRYREEGLRPVVVMAFVRTPTPSRRVVAVATTSACATVLNSSHAVDETVEEAKVCMYVRWWW